MDAQRVDSFLITAGKFFPEEQISLVRERLLQADENKLTLLTTAQFKDPIISLIISFFAGALGIDRFYIGDTGLGIAKLLTCGGLGIWTIIDYFMIMGATREKNLQKLNQILGI